MIAIKVTKIPFVDIETGQIAETGESWFKNCGSDKEADLYLKKIHDEKMDIACNKTGIGHYTPGKITRPSRWNRVAHSRDATNDYQCVQQNIPYVLQIEISHP